LKEDHSEQEEIHRLPTMEVMSTNPDRCPVYASFFGAMGCAFAIVFTVFGASYGTAKSAGAIFSSGILRPERLMQNTLCAIMAQILSIYGLVASVIISGGLEEMMPLYKGFLQLGAGLSVGLSGLAAGFAIGIVGDAGVRASTQQPRLYVGMVLILIFAEVLGLYGVIVSILMLTKAGQTVTKCLA
jgi:V-type H+-transporting ATPase proteolipid subunit